MPELALSGWEGLVTFDAGTGAGFFSTYRFGMQDFGGPVQIVATMGVRVNPFSHAYAGFRAQHFSDAGLYGSSSLGVDMYIVELRYRFQPRRRGTGDPVAREQAGTALPPYGFHPDNTHRCAISGVKLPTSSETLVMTSSASP